jgi:hypothetical protein
VSSMPTSRSTTTTTSIAALPATRFTSGRTSCSSSIGCGARSVALSQIHEFSRSTDRRF